MKPEELKERARKLGLKGLLSRWEEFSTQPWVETVVSVEEAERQRRSLERRLRNAKIGAFKPIADFDWSWPKKIDRVGIEDLFSLEFAAEAANVVLVGGNGLGKTMIAQNLAYQAILRGYTALKVTVSEMLTDLAAQESSAALQRRLSRYTYPTVLLLDEVGYLPFVSRHGDLLFEVVTRRHLKKSIVLTTNKVFSEWGMVFPGSACVTALIDRLVHKAEIFRIEGESYREKEAHERAERKARERQARRRREKARP